MWSLRLTINSRRAMARWMGLAMGAAVLVGCRMDMQDAPRFDPMEKSSLWKDGNSARPNVPGTIARGELRDGREGFFTGRNVDGTILKGLPEEVKLSKELLERGQERYNIYCTPCHDYTGSGLGVIVQRGFKQPPTFHNARLREAGLGHYVDVITHGYGSMYSYAPSVKPADRWAIAAYIRTLQYSQYAPESAVPAGHKADLDKGAKK